MFDLLPPAMVAAALSTFDVPGLSVVVIKDDTVVLEQGFGVRQLGGTAPVDAHTLFAIGSISKSVTALCLAMLVDAGQLRWDDPVIQHLPSFQLSDSYVTREITIRDLLVHRSGLASVSGGTLWYGSSYSRAEVVHRLRYLMPVSSFRSQYAYQNVTYLVAGQIVEALTGQTWDNFVRERIFAPLGMPVATTTIPNEQQVANIATPHALVGGSLQPVAHRNYDNVAPAASIYAGALELAQYLRLFLSGGAVDGVRLVDAARIAELWSAQTVIPIETPHQELASLTPQFYAYALGWFVRDYRGHKLITHSGGVDGMTALVTMVPDAGLGVVVLSNGESPLIGPITYRLLDHYLGLPHTDLFANYQAVYEKRKAKQQADLQQRDAVRVANTTPSLPLDHYTGTYHDRLYGDASVRQVGDQLMLEFAVTPSFTADLTHWHYDTFLITWRDPVIPSGLVSFPLNAEGRVAAMEFAQPKLLDVDFAELNFRRVQLAPVAAPPSNT